MTPGDIAALEGLLERNETTCDTFHGSLNENEVAAIEAAIGETNERGKNE
jgi:hypothetical protein